MADLRKSQAVDWVLVASIFAQLLLGIYLNDSISIAPEYDLHLSDHVMFIFVSIGISLLVFHLWSAEFLQKYSQWFFLLVLGLLATTLLPGFGYTSNSTNRWLLVGPVIIYVMPIATLGVFIWLSRYLDLHYFSGGERGNNWFDWSVSYGLARLIVFFVGFSAIAFYQPDVKALVVLVLVSVAMLACIGRYWQAGLSLLAVTLISMFVIGPASYRFYRLFEFLEPFENRFDSTYQLTQSLISIGGGNIFGVGLGKSLMMDSLPNAHSGFLFAILAEELGVSGALWVAGISLLIFWRGLLISRRLFERNLISQGLLSLSISLWLAMQSIGHMSVCLGLMPTMNFHYPLMSYDAGSMVACLMGLAIILRLGMDTVLVPKLEEPYPEVIGVFQGIMILVSALYLIVAHSAIGTAVFDKRLDEEYKAVTQMRGTLCSIDSYVIENVDTYSVGVKG